MGKEVNLMELIPNIDLSGQVILGSNLEFKTKDANNYIRMKHIVLNRDVFVSGVEAFVYIKKIQELNEHIILNKKFDEKTKDILRDIILITMKIDSYNGIKRTYTYKIRNKKLYIL